MIKRKGILIVNLMGSPGTGKSTKKGVLKRYGKILIQK